MVVVGVGGGGVCGRPHAARGRRAGGDSRESRPSVSVLARALFCLLSVSLCCVSLLCVSRAMRGLCVFVRVCVRCVVCESDAAPRRDFNRDRRRTPVPLAAPPASLAAAAVLLLPRPAPLPTCSIPSRTKTHLVTDRFLIITIPLVALTPLSCCARAIQPLRFLSPGVHPSVSRRAPPPPPTRARLPPSIRPAAMVLFSRRAPPGPALVVHGEIERGRERVKKEAEGRDEGQPVAGSTHSSSQTHARTHTTPHIPKHNSPRRHLASRSPRAHGSLRRLAARPPRAPWPCRRHDRGRQRHRRLWRRRRRLPLVRASAFAHTRQPPRRHRVLPPNPLPLRALRPCARPLCADPRCRCSSRQPPCRSGRPAHRRHAARRRAPRGRARARCG